MIQSQSVVKIRMGQTGQEQGKLQNKMVLRNCYYCPIDWSILVCWRNMHSGYSKYGQVLDNKSRV